MPEWGAFFDVNFFIISCSLTRKICGFYSVKSVFFNLFMSYLSFKYMVSTVNLKLIYESKIPHQVFIDFYCQFWKLILIHSLCLLSFGLSQVSFLWLYFFKLKKNNQTKKEEKYKQNQKRNSTKYQKSINFPRLCYHSMKSWQDHFLGFLVVVH